MYLRAATFTIIICFVLGIFANLLYSESAKANLTRAEVNAAFEQRDRVFLGIGKAIEDLQKKIEKLEKEEKKAKK